MDAIVRRTLSFTPWRVFYVHCSLAPDLMRWLLKEVPIELVGVMKYKWLDKFFSMRLEENTYMAKSLGNYE